MRRAADVVGGLVTTDLTRMQRVQQLLQPWLSFGVASANNSKQVLLPLAAQFQGEITASQRACLLSLRSQFSSSSSSSGSCRQQDCVHATLQQSTWPQCGAAASMVQASAMRTGWLQANVTTARHLCRSITTTAAVSSSSSSSKTKLPRLHSAQELRKYAELDFKSTTLNGQVFHQYTLPVPYFESGAFPSPKKTRDYVWKWVENKMQNLNAARVSKTNIPGFSSDRLREEVADIYLAVQRAQALMQPDLVREMVPKSVFDRLRAQTERRRRNGWTRVDWELLDSDNLAKNVKQVQARAAKLLPESAFDWLQYTYCISSKQRFAAYDRENRLVAGNPDEVMDVTEYVVFERKTRSKVKGTPGGTSAAIKSVLKDAANPVQLEGSRWRLVAWLDP